jgi:uncharacterized damage-inducible protein DinB
MSENRQGDTSVLTKLFKHNTWANLKLLAYCENLTDEQLDTAAVGCFGSIRDTLVHITYGEVDAIHLATNKLAPESLSSTQFPGFDLLKERISWASDRFLQLAISARADTIVEVRRPDEPIYRFPLASFLVQAINHSTEHRTQISTIITQLGMEPPSMSGWTYMREIGEFQELPNNG